MSPAAPVIACRPFLKWAGGKTRLLPEILKRIPKRYGTYVEPFVGGGAVFFALSPARAILGDANRDLVRTYDLVKSDPDALIAELASLQKKHWRAPKTTYRRWRALWNAWNRNGGGCADVDVAMAAAFIYLNRTCFNGLWRVNKKGKFNVPIGRYTKPTICDTLAIQDAAKVLERARIHDVDYRWLASNAAKGDFCYFDPPYDPVSKTSSFRAYTSGGFGRDQQAELADLAKATIGRGVQVMLSNADTPFVRSLYKDKAFRVERVLAPRAINSHAGRRGKVNELLITGGYRRHW